MFSKGLSTKLGWGDVSMHQVFPCLYIQFFAYIYIFFLAFMYILVPTNILCMNKILFDEGICLRRSVVRSAAPCGRYL